MSRAFLCGVPASSRVPGPCLLQAAPNSVQKDLLQFYPKTQKNETVFSGSVLRSGSCPAGCFLLFISNLMM